MTLSHHPDLAPLARMGKAGEALLLLVILLCLGLVGAGIALAVAEGLWPGWVVGLTGVGGAFAFWRLLDHVRSKLTTSLATASALLWQVPPRSMRLEFDGVIGWSGYAALLHAPEGGMRPWGVILQAGKHNLPPRGRTRVMVHAGENPEQLLVIRLEKSLLLGNRRSWPRLGDEARKVNRVLSGLVLSVAGMFLFMVSLFALESWQAREELELARASRAWPTVSGTVTSSGVVTQVNSGGRGAPREYFQARILYRYVVDGQSFRGERVRYGREEFRDRRQAGELAARYPEGGVVMVHHLPRDPAQAVLEPGHEETLKERHLHFTVGALSVLVAGGAVSALLWFLLARDNRRKWERLQQTLEQDGS